MKLKWMIRKNLFIMIMGDDVLSRLYFGFRTGEYSVYGRLLEDFREERNNIKRFEKLCSYVV